MKKYKFGVLGAGNMGTAIAEGAVRAGRFTPEQVLMFNRSEEKRAAHAAKGYAVTGDYDAIVLDVMMPKLNGVEVLERLRAEGVRTPVMLLTAKAEKDDRITGFNAGADDYLPKPFAPDELICRVRAILRRGGEYRPTVLTFGDAALDCSTGMLSCAGQSVRLSGREFQVMELFLRAPKVVLSAERILERVWGWDSDAEINVVWVHISNLRKKLKGIGSTVTIRANRGLGYVLEAGDD